MKEKLERQQRISEIIREHQIHSQDELLKCLRQKGIRVTQATLSRDVAEMGVVQASGPDGRQYSLPVLPAVPTSIKEICRRFKNNVAGIKHTNNLVIVRTLPGEASGTGRLVDDLNLDYVLGTIAGDDTLLIILKSKQYTSKMITLIEGD